MYTFSILRNLSGRNTHYHEVEGNLNACNILNLYEIMLKL